LRHLVSISASAAARKPSPIVDKRCLVERSEMAGVSLKKLSCPTFLK
jgi:hypothetical protein